MPGTWEADFEVSPTAIPLRLLRKSLHRGLEVGLRRSRLSAKFPQNKGKLTEISCGRFDWQTNCSARGQLRRPRR